MHLSYWNQTEPEPAGHCSQVPFTKANLEEQNTRDCTKPFLSNHMNKPDDDISRLSSSESASERAFSYQRATSKAPPCCWNGLYKSM